MFRTAAAAVTTALATTVAPVLVGLPTAAPAAAASSTCETATYQTKVRRVTGTESIRFSRLEAITYPGRTTIQEGQKVKVAKARTLTAGVTTGMESTLGASAMLKKVINVYASISGHTEFKARVSTTATEETTITSSVKIVIPGGKSVAWFRGWRRVGGTFQWSWCHHYSGMPEGYGTVTWEKGTFRSYGYRSTGGQRCDLTAQEPVARAAKRAVCG